MKQLRTLIDDAFHALAQPVMALRATVELGLSEEPDKLEAQRVLGECLRLIDALTQEMAVAREIANVEDATTLTDCNGEALLCSCVEEMSAVAHEGGVAVFVDAKAATMKCDEMILRRALFVLLDGMLAAMPHGGEIRLQLEDEESDFLRLVARPPMPRGLRQNLCWKLMQAAGGQLMNCADGSMAMLFHKATDRSLPPIPLIHERVLTSH
jgi:signal transduction histidine kinase